jgi:hypothetical protein
MHASAASDLLEGYSARSQSSGMTSAGRFYKTGVVVTHALVGWAYCGTIIGVGRRLLSVHTTLIIHAIGAPVGFALISYFYHRRFAYTSPSRTALAFLAVVFALDFFLVAPVFEKNYSMFSSLLGTWIPFALIFAATYVAGRFTSTAAKTRGQHH